MSFAKSMVENVSGKYRKKLLDSAKKARVTNVATDPFKTAIKRAEATADLNVNKIADEIIF